PRMTALYLLDDAIANDFMPFTLTRPVSELRAGAMLIRERWERAFGAPAIGIVAAPHLADFEEPGAPPVVASVPAGAIVANARCLVPLGWSDSAHDVWRCGGEIAAVRLDREVDAAELAAGSITLDRLARSGRESTVPGRWLAAI